MVSLNRLRRDAFGQVTLPGDLLCVPTQARPFLGVFEQLKNDFCELCGIARGE